MIRAFRPSDLEIKCNGYTEHYIRDHLHDIMRFDKRTLEIDGEPQAIICFINYNLQNYKGFFIVSEGFKPEWMKELKKAIQDLAKELDAKRLETESIDDERLNHWHLSLGFIKEGFKRKYMNNQDYNVWGMLWE